MSGANLAMVAGAASLLFRPTRWRRGTKSAALAAVIAVYVLAVGYEPSVVRAAGVAGLVLAAQWLGRPRAGLVILLATALGLLWFDPFLAVNAGFALSVAATRSIIAFAKTYAEQWCRVLRVPYWLSLPLAVTTVARCACTPLLILLNPSLPTYAVPANALAAPVVAPLTVVALAASVEGREVSTFELYTRHTGQGTMLAAPMVTVLVTRTAGELPVGVTVQGLRGADAAVLALAALVESVV
ncbi:ComEC/Rec2 family competence protein [Micrococcales bacterium 31B]|nr:ComEC/Rec2 family competence protein [Micrococcales bacterium 31B]